MILSNEQVFAALDSGRLRITPEPQPRRRSIDSNDDYCPYDTHEVVRHQFAEHFVLHRMAKKRGAPRKPPARAKAELLQIRLGATEKQAFAQAAALDGKKISEWVRDRLRLASRQELAEHGVQAPFLTGQGPASELR